MYSMEMKWRMPEPKGELADVMDATDVRMRDLACRANFTVKSRDHRSIAGKNFKEGISAPPIGEV